MTGDAAQFLVDKGKIRGDLPHLSLPSGDPGRMDLDPVLLILMTGKAQFIRVRMQEHAGIPRGMTRVTSVLPEMRVLSHPRLAERLLIPGLWDGAEEMQRPQQDKGHKTDLYAPLARNKALGPCSSFSADAPVSCGYHCWRVSLHRAHQERYSHVN